MNYFSRSNRFLTSNILKKHLNKISIPYRLINTHITLQNNSSRKNINDGPSLKDFLSNNSSQQTIDITEEPIPYLANSVFNLKERKVYFLVFGCQMNVNDTEIVWSILKKNNFVKTDNLEEADVVLIMTCSIREGAEKKIWNQLNNLKGFRRRKGKHEMKIGVLGCMAERLKDQLIEKEKAVDLVAGPDSYKDLPRLLALTEHNQTAINVMLSLDETYADVIPLRLDENSKSAFVSIMRGCDNMCTYCIVPFTRGKERSRPIDSILSEIQYLSDRGYKEVTLLGQNVNSFRDLSVYGKDEFTKLAPGFKTVYKTKKGGLRFADLLDKVSSINPEMRIRFTSPHPKDFPNDVLEVISSHKNICKSLHIPAQSGNSSVLERMRRGYTREDYVNLIKHIRSIIPQVSLSSDFICGFCHETDEEFEDTITLIEEVKYNMAYLFPYSLREKTTAHRRLKDDVPIEIKNERLLKMINTFRTNAEYLNKAQIGKVHLVLIERNSKRSNEMLVGRNDGNTRVIIPTVEIPIAIGCGDNRNIYPGDYVAVLIQSANSQTLTGIPLFHSTIEDFDHLAIEETYLNLKHTIAY